MEWLRFLRASVKQMRRAALGSSGKRCRLESDSTIGFALDYEERFYICQPLHGEEGGRRNPAFPDGAVFEQKKSEGIKIDR